MKDNIVIKKFPNGIKLYLNSELNFEELINEVALKFSQSRHFFRDAKVALALEGRILSEEEEQQIVTAIQLNSDVDILCIVDDNEDSDSIFKNAIAKTQLPYSDNYGQFYHGTLKNNQKIEIDSNIIIMGDVYPGSCVMSSKNIIIIGGLYGEAHAGVGSDSSHYVVALEMSPERIRIGDFRYKPNDKPRWNIRHKVQPKIAFVKEKQIVTETITKDLLETLSF